MSMFLNLLSSSTLLFTIFATFAKGAPINGTLSEVFQDDNEFVKRGISGGPVINSNFADPSIFHSTNGRGAQQGWWYAFATRPLGGTIHVPVAQSPDFNGWTLLQGHDALPNLPPWVSPTAQSSNVWAPDVIQTDAGQYVMYFSASTRQNPAVHCIGIATSNNILGPYNPQPNPLICPMSGGGAIDPSGFRDQDGTVYLTWKVDGNNLGTSGLCRNDPPYHSTPIMLQGLSRDGLSLIGPATQIMNNDGAGDAGIVEAPSLAKIPNGHYFLFFSTGCFKTTGYTVSYATSPSPRGPFTRRGTLIGTNGNLVAPGGARVSFDQQHMVFHANIANGQRGMYTAQIRLSGTTASL